MQKIAVIGQSCRFPRANNINEFKQLIYHNIDAITETPETRWSFITYPKARWGGFITNINQFDADFFGISKREANAMDPQQRLLLELSWEALESAGITKEVISGSNTGVFIGISTDDYSRIQPFDINQLDPYISTANAKSIAANRISYLFNLHGPSIAIDTACSSSLVAIHQACQSLSLSQINLAIVGGVNLMLNPGITIALAESGMLSQEGKCKTFDANADGYVRGEGAGIVILKKYDEAIRDQDPILAIIVGSACNQDGASNGMTAPNAIAQEHVIREALDQAGLTGKELQYVEAHGTGTPLGDPIEIMGLANVLQSSDEKNAPTCAVGSVKTNIGHLEAAAGIAGLIKTIIVLQEQIIPPLLHLKKINPSITSDEKKSIYFPNESKKNNIEYAGVSSFGFGGTNAHVILGKSQLNKNKVPDLKKNKTSKKNFLLVLSAQNSHALKEKSEQYASYFNSESNSLSEISYYLFKKRSHLDYRLALVSDTKKGFINQLNYFVNNKKNYTISVGKIEFDPRLVWVFSGQGGQYPAMAHELFAHEIVFQKAIYECEAAIASLVSWSLADLFLEKKLTEVLTNGIYSQPMQVALQIALGKLWLHWGIVPNALVGHSLGELAAAHFAGILTLAETMELALRRGESMSSFYKGKMLNCKASIDELAPILTSFKEKISISVFNSITDLVLSGEENDLHECILLLKSEQIEYQWVDVPAAFHSRLMIESVSLLKGKNIFLNPKKSNIPFYSTLMGCKMEGDDLTIEYWCKQITSPVLFYQTIEVLIEDQFVNFLEIGPHPILNHAIASNLKNKNGLVLYSLDKKQANLSSLYHSLGKLYVNGFKINYPINLINTPTTMVLPEYPWQKQSYWFQNDISKPNLASPSIEINNIPLSQKEILNDISEKLAGLLHCSKDDIDVNKAFVELGTDSIIIAKAVNVIENDYGIHLTMRQFFEDVSTPNVLSNYLFDNAKNSVKNNINNITEKKYNRINTALKSHGPYKPATLKNRTQYTASQEVFIKKWIDNYVTKTQHSKNAAAKARLLLADSRASAGFRPSIKELLYPIIGKYSKGTKIIDIDNNEYLDISMDFGANLFGHAPEFIKTALKLQIDNGLALAPRANHMGEVAELLTKLTNTDRVVFCTTGTEAVMTAIRLARLATQRQKIIMFNYSYHGHSDNVLAAISGTENSSTPVVSGVVDSAIYDTIVLHYNDPGSLLYIEENADQIASVIVEAVQARRPSLQPRLFLHTLSSITKKNNIIFIIDEMITGFRLAPGGAQEFFNIKADIATYGKILGGGCPLSAIAGRSDILDGIDGGKWQYGDSSYPAKATTFFAGTFNGYSLGITAAHAVLSEITRLGHSMYDRLNNMTKYLATALNDWFFEEKIPIEIVYCGSLFRFDIKDNLDIFFYKLIENGIFIWEGRNCFLSTAHSEDDVYYIISTIKSIIKELKNIGLINSQTYLPLTLAQKQLIAITKLSRSAGLSYQESSLIKLEGDINIKRLIDAWSEVIARHESLRLRVHLNSLEFIILKQARFTLEIIDGLDKDVFENWLKMEIEKPFNFNKDFLFKASLLKITEKKYYMLIVMHHIIADGWSFGVLINELFMIYHQLDTTNGLDLKIQKIPTQLTDYIHWQNTIIPQLNDARLFWKSVLEKPYVPIFQSSMDNLEWNGSYYEEIIPKAIAKKIKLFSKDNQCSLFITLLSCYQSFIHEFFDKNDIIIGCPTSGRTMSGSDNLIAYCTHILPIYSRFENDESFYSFLNKTKKTMLSAFDHQSFPFSEMIKEFVGQETKDIIQVIFNIDKVDSDLINDKISISLCHSPNYTANFPLSLHIKDNGKNLKFNFKYQNNYFDKYQIKSLSKNFLQWTIDCIEKPNLSFKQRSVLSHDEIHQIMLSNKNDTFVSDISIVTMFKNQVQSRPDQLALLYENKQYSYYEVNKLTDTIAYHLSKFKLKKDSIIAIKLSNKQNIILAMLGVIKAGCAFLILDETIPKDREEKILSISKCCLIISDLKQQDRSEFIVHFDHLIHDVFVETMPTQIATNTIAYVVFTSGSTGEPKGVIIEHSSFVNFTFWINKRINLNDKHIDCSANLCFDFGLATSLAALLSGSSIFILNDQDKLDLRKYIDHIIKNKIQVIKLTPSYFHLLLNEVLFEYANLSSIKKILLAGEAIDKTDCEKWLSIYPSHRIINCYGPTETTVSVLMHDINECDRQIPLGKPEHNIHAYILNHRQKLTPIDQEGELYLGGSCLARGYINNNILTQDRFPTISLPTGITERLYRTGDIVKYQRNGEIEFIGRIDEQVKIKGYRIEINEITEAIRKHPDINDVAVLEKDKNLIAFCVIHHNDDTTTIERSLKKYLKNILPNYMIPVKYFFINTIPLNKNLKIDKKGLLKLIPSSINVMEQHHHDIEHIILSEINFILSIENAKLSDNFFSLGGDSISAILLVSRLREMGIHIPVKYIYQSTNINELIENISSAFDIPDQIKLQGKCLLTPIQMRFFTKNLENTNHYNQAFYGKIKNALSLNSLQIALNHIINFHDSFCLVYKNNNSKIEQSYNERLVESKIISYSIDYDQIDTLLYELQTKFCLNESPLITMAIIKNIKTKDQYLFIAIHHLIIDGVSWQIFLNDLFMAYKNIELNKPIQLLPKSYSYQCWAEQYVGYATKIDSQVMYWKNQLPKAKSEIIKKSTAITDFFTLDEDISYDLIHQAPTYYDAHINSILLSALVYCFKLHDVIYLMLEGHGRENAISHLDFSRTVGWFTSIFPIKLSNINDSILNHVKHIDHYLKSIPDKGVGYGALKYLSTADLFSDAFEPDLCFNYLGQSVLPPITSDYLTQEYTEPNGISSYTNNLMYNLEINVVLKNGKLHIYFKSSDLYYLNIKIDTLMTNYREQLNQMVRYGKMYLSSKLNENEITHIFNDCVDNDQVIEIF